MSAFRGWLFRQTTVLYLPARCLAVAPLLNARVAPHAPAHALAAAGGWDMPLFVCMALPLRRAPSFLF